MIKVFLVDDHKIFLDGLKVFIEKEPDIEVTGMAFSGPEALKKLNNIDVDVAVLDIAMPGMKGVELTRKIIGSHPSIRVMALSMYANNYIISDLISAGARAYVLKDCSSTDLLLAIRGLYVGGMYFCEKVASMICKDYIKLMEQNPATSDISLSNRELEILKLLVDGKKVSEIEDTLHISKNTVNTHRSNIMTKLNCDTIVDLIRYSIRKGIFELDK